MSELRQDPITRERVIISPERNQRPKDTPQSQLPCPFCPGNERLTPEATDIFIDGGS